MFGFAHWRAPTAMACRGTLELGLSAVAIHQQYVAALIQDAGYGLALFGSYGLYEAPQPKSMACFLVAPAASPPAKC